MVVTGRGLGGCLAGSRMVAVAMAGRVWRRRIEVMVDQLMRLMLYELG